MVALLGILVGLVLVVLAYQGTRLYLEIHGVRSGLGTLQTQLGQDDLTKVRRTAADVEASAAAAHRRSDNLVFRGLSHVPLLGGDVRAARQMTAVVDEIAHRALPQALTLAQRSSGNALRSADGRFDVRRIAALQAPVARLSRTLATIQRDADAVPARHVLLPPLRHALEKAQGQVDDLAGAARSGVVATRLLPTMLGGHGTRHYLLIVQNNAEARSTGGLVGTVAKLTLADGRLRLGGQISDAKFPILTTPVLPLSHEETATYGPVMGEDLRDTNLTPDFRRTGQLVRAMFQRQFGGDADGVISVDPIALSMVLEATGPISGGAETFTAGNVVDKFLHSVYQRYPGAREQDAYFATASAQIFSGVSQGRGNERALVMAVAHAVGQRRLLVWSTHPAEERLLEGTTVGGTMDPPGATGPDVGVYINDATVAKMQYYLRYDASVASTSCDSGTQTITSRFVMRSSAPPGGRGLVGYIRGDGRLAPLGGMRMNVRFYSPVGGRVLKIQADGHDVPIARTTQDGRDVAIVVAMLNAQQYTDFTVTFRARRGDTGDPLMRWTPGVANAPTQTTAPTSCG